MTTRRRPGQVLYAPTVGELVFDRVEQRTGVYQGITGGRMYLRPVGGGVEWSPEPWELAPIETAEDAA